MKKGEIYDAVVDTIEFPNKGILHVDGETVVVKNALPGQVIRFLIDLFGNIPCMTQVRH